MNLRINSQHRNQVPNSHKLFSIEKNIFTFTYIQSMTIKLISKFPMYRFNIEYFF